jgi:2-polyprenyl-6-hydroxyphenyl methylase/3-demethylubiquinone-9 3-methyltransferase
MTATGTTTTSADRLLKDKHRALWASGDYGAVATDLIADLGPVLVAASGVASGQRVLDVGAGTGNASLAAAAAGASVVASDLTPELMAEGERAAAARGLDVTWVEADAEALPFETGEFDTVLSCVGAMFAPHHQAAADEMLRVCRPGGTVAMVNWTPEGFIGHLFATLKPFAPTPPPGVEPAPRWGSEDHVRELFGDRVTDLRLVRRTTTFDHSPDPTAFREYWKQHYGPTIAVYAANAADPAATAALDEAFLSFLTDWDTAPSGHPAHYEAEYLLVRAITRV